MKLRLKNALPLVALALTASLFLRAESSNLGYGAASAQSSNVATSLNEQETVSITVYNSNLGLGQRCQTANLAQRRHRAKVRRSGGQNHAADCAHQIADRSGPFASSRTELRVRSAYAPEAARKVCRQRDHHSQRRRRSSHHHTQHDTFF